MKITLAKYHRCVVAIGFCLLWLAGFTHAAAVQNLYSATVPITAQSDAEQRRAVRQGLADVLVKTTGTRAALNDTAVRAALGQAETYMLEFGYIAQMAADGSSGNALAARYAPALVDRLLRERQLPIWPANRPEWVVWTVLDRPAGLQFVDAEGDAALYVQMEQAFARRGVAHQFPLLDQQDQLTISTEQAWNFDAAALSEAAKRYGATYGFLVRYSRSASGEWQGGWLLAGPGASEKGSVASGDADGLVVSAIDAAVDRFSPRFAYAGGGGQTHTVVVLENVDSYRRYTQALALLNTLEMVADVQVVRVEGDRLHLSVKVDGDSQILADALARDGNLEPITVAEGPSADGSYWFRWRGAAR